MFIALSLSNVTNLVTNVLVDGIQAIGYAELDA